MIRLLFNAQNRELVIVEIEQRKVVWRDKLSPHGLQIYPLNKTLVSALENSRSEINRQKGQLIKQANSGKDLDEYNSCTSDEMIAEFIKRDAISQGLTLLVVPDITSAEALEMAKARDR